MANSKDSRKRINDLLVKELQPSDKKYCVWDDKTNGFGIEVLPSGRKTYWLRQSHNRKWHWHKIGSADILTPTEARKSAERVRGEWVKSWAKGGDPIAERKAARQATKAATLGEFAEGDYAKNWLSQRRSGAGTLSRLKSCFPEFWNKPMESITLGAVEKWRAARIADGRRKKNEKQKSGCSRATVNRDITTLKACLSKALDWGIIPVHPLARLKPLSVDSTAKVRYLLPEEEKRLEEALDSREERLRTERDSANAWRRERGYPEWPDLRKLAFADYLKPLVLLSLHTGLRRGEAFSLEWGDIDMERGMLTVQGKTAKSGKTRHVPLNSFILQVLKDWEAQAPDTGLVFPSPVTGGRLDNCNSSWEEVLSQAKIDAFRWHDMRHHFASKLVMAGVDLNTVRDLLGHSSINMTLRYAHLAPEAKAAAVERLVVPEGKVVRFPKKRKA